MTEGQQEAVRSDKRRLLIVAGAGSGKTEVMARRVAWWVGVEGVEQRDIVAFTFTERAAEEMKLRIRRRLKDIAPEGKEIPLGEMYVGTIHGFCIDKLREFWPDEYHNYDILDEGARMALIQDSFHGTLSLNRLKEATGEQHQRTVIEQFIRAYDLLNDNARFEVCLPSAEMPINMGEEEREWCKEAGLTTDVGDEEAATAFARSAARYYAYLRCRRFLDFSTSQSELVRKLKAEPSAIRPNVRLVVDEMQDINPVQRELIDLLQGFHGCLTAVGDHRQAIYAWRGARVEIISDYWEAFKSDPEATVVNLRENFRSTPRIISLANKWAETIGANGGMEAEGMEHGGSPRRIDHHASHIARLQFADRGAESAWIAKAIRELVPDGASETARHDKPRSSEYRGLALSDIAVLVRTSRDARQYMKALADRGIAAVVRAGPDLFSQPEVLLILSALAESAGVDEFWGAPGRATSLPGRVKSVLDLEDTPLTPEAVYLAAAEAVRQEGLEFPELVQDRLFFAAQAIRRRVSGGVRLPHLDAQSFRKDLRSFLTSRPDQLRRLFPQRIFHMLLGEGEVEAWDAGEERGRTAMFHLGALSKLITGIETPGWTRVDAFRRQIIGLCQYGEQQGRVEEQPLMVQPDAVSICTIHAVKGLEFAAVFLADVNAHRFPGNQAKTKVKVPLGEDIAREVSLESLSDNENHDGERRLMYVALTRAERFLFISANSRTKSKFFRGLEGMVEAVGGIADGEPSEVLQELRRSPKDHKRDINFATSFSDLRYYFECPHDFYLRKVLGFAPTIGQEFGYGRGVHNLMRAVHAEPKRWAELAADPASLEREVRKLINQGLFYLRYTVGTPADNMRNKGVRVAMDYIRHYIGELGSLSFEPEKPFEAVIDFADGTGDGALVSGAIDLVRGDDPPRVTLIDFKSGDMETDKRKQLSEEQMRRQIGIYALAAKKEFEYQPDMGIVRYLDEGHPAAQQLEISLDNASMERAREEVSSAVTAIRARVFDRGPTTQSRCATCDFMNFCGRSEAREARSE